MYYIVQTIMRLDVFTHHVNSMCKQQQSIECRASSPRLSSSMSRFTMEDIVDTHFCQTGTGVYGIHAWRVPVEHKVNILIKAVAHDVGLTRTTLFCRWSVNADCTLGTSFLKPLSDGNACSRRSHTEKVVSTAMTRFVFKSLLAIGHCILWQTWQGIKLCQQSYNG